MCSQVDKGEMIVERERLWKKTLKSVSFHVNSWLIGKDSDAGRDWGQREKGTTEDEMAGWHHWLDGRESEWTPGVGDEQWGLACCNSWGPKESDTTERLNWTELKNYKNLVPLVFFRCSSMFKFLVYPFSCCFSFPFSITRLCSALQGQRHCLWFTGVSLGFSSMLAHGRCLEKDVE